MSHVDERRQAPVVRSRSKTAWHPSMIDALIGDAMRVGAHIPQSMPVFAGGEVIGVVRGDGLGTHAWFDPCTHREFEASGFPNYNTLNTALKNGQRCDAYYRKDGTNDIKTKLWGDWWPLANIPSAGDYSGVAITDRHFDNTTLGGFYLGHRTPGAGQTRHFIGWEQSMLATNNVNPWWGIVYDRVMTYDGCIVSTVPTTFINGTPAARYISTGQDGLLIMPTVGSTNGLDNTAATLTAITATDQLGNTAVNILPAWTVNYRTNANGVSTTAPAYSAMPYDTGGTQTMTPFMPLPGGVSGVRKLEGMTSSVIYLATSTVCMALVKPLGFIWQSASQEVQTVNFPRTMFSLERIRADACVNVCSVTGFGQAHTTMGRLITAHA